MAHSNIQTTMISVHAARRQKGEATAKLQALAGAARKAKQLREEEAERLKPPEDEWGSPVYEDEAESSQNPPQEREIEGLPF